MHNSHLVATKVCSVTIEYFMAETQQLNPSHLFISYATQDVALAGWLARKLAARGHQVWFDQMKLLS